MRFKENCETRSTIGLILECNAWRVMVGQIHMNWTLAVYFVPFIMVLWYMYRGIGRERC